MLRCLHLHLRLRRHRWLSHSRHQNRRPRRQPPPVDHRSTCRFPSFSTRISSDAIRSRSPCSRCTAGDDRLLQLSGPLALHTHSDLDEILYVVAGDGVVRVRDETMTLAPGSLTVIPRGLPHATERRGRNPLIVLSTLAGAACPAALREEASGSRR